MNDIEEGQNQLCLVLGESDFDKATISEAKAVAEGQEILSDQSEDSKRILFNSLPSVIAKRVKSITPDNFNINEIELKMNLKGCILGNEIGGEIVVKLSPK